MSDDMTAIDLVGAATEYVKGLFEITDLSKELRDTKGYLKQTEAELRELMDTAVPVDVSPETLAGIKRVQAILAENAKREIEIAYDRGFREGALQVFRFIAETAGVVDEAGKPIIPEN